MAFSDTLCTEARPIWEAIQPHPFLRELQAGTLPIEKFRFFLAQDWHYLDAFARTVGLLLGRRLPPVSHPVYGEWAAFYREGFLRESVSAWRGLLDETAAEAGPFEREDLREAFLTSSCYEHAFWEMAYRMETWPV